MKFGSILGILAFSLAIAQAQAGEVQKPEFSITLPDGWAEIPQDTVAKGNEARQRMAPEVRTPMPKYGFERRHAGSDKPGARPAPYIMVVVSSNGRTPLSAWREMQAVDMNREVEKHKGETSSIISNRSFSPLVYDEAANIVWDSQEFEAKGLGRMKNLDGMIPTQKGFVQFIADVPVAESAKWLPEIRRIILSVKIAPELRYQSEDALLRRAGQGELAAQLALGDLYVAERGRDNEAEAAKWYGKAAEQGNARAQYRLAIMCRLGRGVAEDEAAERTWLRKSADQGYGLAQYELAKVYGAARDEKEAVKLLGQAADQGVLEAADALWKAAPGEAEAHARLHRLGNAELGKKLQGEWLPGLSDELGAYVKRKGLKEAFATGAIHEALRFDADGTVQVHPPCDATKPGPGGSASKASVSVSGRWHIDDHGVLVVSFAPPGEARSVEKNMGIPEFYRFDGGVETMLLRLDNRKAGSFGRLDEAAMKCE